MRSPRHTGPPAVVFASNTGDFGGGEVMLLAFARAAREAGYAVTVVAPAEPATTADYAEAAGFATVRIPGASRPAYIRGLRRWDRGRGEALLWCNGLVPSFATAGHHRRIVEVHQLPVGSQRHAFRVARAGAKAVIVPSPFMAAQLPGTSPLENWTSAPGRAAAATRPMATPLTVGFLGRLSQDKGVDVLARAVELIDRRAPGSVRLLVGGEPRFVAEAQRQAVEAALAPIAALTERPGWISRDDFFDRVDIAVFPSVWPEPFGLVAAEAMAARVPVIVSSAGALPDVVGSNHPFVVPPGDPESLARLIESMTTLPELVTRSVQDGYVRWTRTYSPQAGAARFRALLDDLTLRGVGRTAR